MATLPTRADRLTDFLKKREIYSDFPTDFDDDAPILQVGKITNEDAVKTALRNLILTRPGERPFQPEFGSKVSSLLFEVIHTGSTFAIQDLDSEIRRVISQYEPRVDLVDVQVHFSEDNHYLIVNIIFMVLNKIEPIDLEIILKRVR